MKKKLLRPRPSATATLFIHRRKKLFSPMTFLAARKLVAILVLRAAHICCAYYSAADWQNETCLFERRPEKLFFLTTDM
jgi:hypothetical protein